MFEMDLRTNTALASGIAQLVGREAPFPADAKEAWRIAVRVPDVLRCACTILLWCLGVIWAPKSLNQEYEGEHADMSSTPSNSSAPAAGWMLLCRHAHG